MFASILLCSIKLFCAFTCKLRILYHASHPSVLISVTHWHTHTYTHTHIYIYQLSHRRIRMNRQPLRKLLHPYITCCMLIWIQIYSSSISPVIHMSSIYVMLKMVLSPSPTRSPCTWALLFSTQRLSQNSSLHFPHHQDVITLDVGNYWRSFWFSLGMSLQVCMFCVWFVVWYSARTSRAARGPCVSRSVSEKQGTV